MLGMFVELVNNRVVVLALTVVGGGRNRRGTEGRYGGHLVLEELR
jgi:hypothetical protein